MTTKARTTARPGRAALLCALAASALYASLSIVNYLRFGTSLDLTIFHQGLASIVGLAPDGVTVKGHGASIFGDHFHPVILVLAPLLLVWNSPVVLLMAQAIALGAAVGIFANTVFTSAWGAGRLSWLRVGVLTVSAGLVSAVMFDFHETPFGAPLVALMARAFVRRRPWAVVGWGLACLLIKEDMAVLVLPVALGLALQRRVAASVLLGLPTLVYPLVVVRWVIPRFNQNGTYTYGANQNLLTQLPHALLHAFVWPGWLTLTTLAMFASVGFLVRNWLLVLPVLASTLYRGSIDYFRYWVPLYHYSVLPLLLLAFATITSDPARAIVRPWQRRVLVAMGVASLLVSPATLDLASTAHTNTTQVRQMLATIPDGAQVVTDPRFSAHLSARTEVAILNPPGFEQQAPWVLVDTATDSWGGGWVDQFTKDHLGRYHLVRESGTLRLYHLG